MPQPYSGDAMGFISQGFGGGDESKFHLGLFTQEALHNILNQMKDVSVNREITTFAQKRLWGIAQHTKYHLLRELYVRALPFLKDEHQKEVKAELSKVKICWRPASGASGGLIYSDEKKPIMDRYEEVYIPTVDNEIDELREKIILYCQKDSQIFKVKKGEQSLF